MPVLTHAKRGVLKSTGFSRHRFWVCKKPPWIGASLWPGPRPGAFLVHGRDWAVWYAATIQSPRPKLLYPLNKAIFAIDLDWRVPSITGIDLKHHPVISVSVLRYVCCRSCFAVSLRCLDLSRARRFGVIPWLTIAILRCVKDAGLGNWSRRRHYHFIPWLPAFGCGQMADVRRLQVR